MNLTMLSQAQVKPVFKYLVQSVCLELKPDVSLHWVRVYLDTQTYDKITKDEKSNFESKLSVIGGTMGLLTGFSIISGFEIVYFGAKIIFSAITSVDKKRKTSTNVK